MSRFKVYSPDQAYLLPPNQFLVIAAAEKIAAMESEQFFAERKDRADRKAFRRILNRKGGEPPRPEDIIG
jgi:hypothetical protein